MAHSHHTQLGFAGRGQTHRRGQKRSYDTPCECRGGWPGVSCGRVGCRLFYRAEAWNATGPGSFLGTESVDTSAEAEQAYNLAKWGNPAQVLRTYRLTESTTMYFGKVAGGEGYQALIPRGVDPSSILQLVSVKSLG